MSREARQKRRQEQRRIERLVKKARAKAPLAPDFRGDHDAFLQWADDLPGEQQDAALVLSKYDRAYFINNWCWLLSLPEGWESEDEDDDDHWIDEFGNQIRPYPEDAPGINVGGEGEPLDLGISQVGWVQFRLWEAQEQFIGDLAGARFHLIVKVRQIGFTWISLILGLHENNFYDNRSGAFMSLEEDRAKHAAWRYEQVWKHLPSWMRQGKGDVWNASEKAFANGSRLTSIATTPNSTVSYTNTWTVVDEAALIEETRGMDLKFIVDRGIVPALRNLGGWCIVVSTGRQPAGWFYRKTMACKAALKINRKTSGGWKLHFFPVTSHPYWTDDEYYKALDEADDPEIFKSEHPRTLEDAFVAAGRCVFNLESLRRRRAEIELPGDDGVMKFQKGQAIAFWQREPHIDPRGATTIYQKPQEGHRYVCSVDPSAGLATGDYGAAIVLDVDTGMIAAVTHGKWPDVYDLADLTIQLAYHYNGATLIPETNKDYGLLRRMVELEYPNLYRRTGHDQDQVEQPLEKWGWKTVGGKDSGSRQKVIARLKREIRCSWLEVPDIRIIRECETFIATNRRPHGEAAPGEYDDLLMAVAIAVYVAIEEPEAIEDAAYNPLDIRQIGADVLQDAAAEFSQYKHPIQNQQESDFEQELASVVPWRDYGWGEESRTDDDGEPDYGLIDEYLHGTTT